MVFFLYALFPDGVGACWSKGTWNKYCWCKHVLHVCFSHFFMHPTKQLQIFITPSLKVTISTLRANSETIHICHSYKTSLQSSPTMTINECHGHRKWNQTVDSDGYDNHTNFQEISSQSPKHKPTFKGSYPSSHPSPPMKPMKCGCLPLTTCMSN